MKWLRNLFNRIFKRGLFAKRYTNDQVQALQSYASLGTGIVKGPNIAYTKTNGVIEDWL